MRRTIDSIIIALGCAALVGVAFADARTLTVGVPDGEGNVTITIGGTGAANQTLIAAWANGDRGADPLDWTEYADAGTVAYGDSAKVFQLPAAWRAKSGVVKFFLMSGEKPYGTRYDYIRRPYYIDNRSSTTDGRFYIDTGIVPDPTLDISVKTQTEKPETPLVCTFGIAGIVCMFSYGDDPDNLYHIGFFGASNSNPGRTDAIIHVGDTNVIGEPAPRDTKPHVFRLCREGVFIDGYRHVAPFDENSFANTTESTIVLFARRPKGATGDWKDTYGCSIYGASIKTNGVLACDFVPAYNSTEGKVGMWNRVNGEWKFASGDDAGTKSFTVGSDIGPYPSDCGMVEAFSSAVRLGPEIAISRINPTTRTVDVSLSSGHGEGLLFAFAGKDDGGTDYSSWTTNAFIQRVAADVDSTTVTLSEGLVKRKQLRFAWKSLAGQPYDYDVEYLHSSSGGAYIDTGYMPKANTAINVKAKAAYNVCAFGIRNYFYLFYTNDRLYAGFLGSSGNLSMPSDKMAAFVADVHDWMLSASGAYVDDREVEYSTVSDVVDSPISVLIPFRKNDTSGVAEKDAGEVDVCGARIWEGSALVRDFVPCVTNGVAVFYDRVNGKFLGSIRSGRSFAAGRPAVTEGDVVSWSDVFAFKQGFVIICK